MTPGTMTEETLADVAQREAAEAEAEFEAGAVPAVQDEGDVSLVDSEPGEQGAATQDEEPAEYQAPEPSQDEVKRALAALKELRARVNDYGPERTVESLVAIVDVASAMRRPEAWPGAEDEEFHVAPEIKEIGTLLLKGCRAKLTLSPKDVIWLWRNKEKWTSRGQTVRHNTKSLDTRTSFLTDGARAVVEVNFHHWATLNPLQKIFTVYHALRELDGTGSPQAPDFVGYFDELEVFGPRVFRDMVTLENSLKRGAERELPYQLSLLDQDEPA